MPSVMLACMTHKVKRIAVTYTMDPALLDRFEQWLARQVPRVHKSSAVETALREFLDRREDPAARRRDRRV